MKRLAESLICERLEKIIQRVYFKCLQSIMVEGRDENDCRYASTINFRQHFKAVHAGHLYIQKQQVGRLLADEVYGRRTAGAFAYDLYLGISLKKVSEGTPGQRLVVNDQSLNQLLRVRVHPLA